MTPAPDPATGGVGRERGGLPRRAVLWYQRCRSYLEQELWSEPPPPGSGRPAALGQRSLQLLAVVAEGFDRHQLLLRASALTYFALLSLVPLLAITFSLVEAFGVSLTLVELVVDRVTPGNPEARQRILELLAQVDFAALGTAGGAALLVTTVLGLSNVERAFNSIWGLRRGRSWSRGFPDYLAVLVVAPLLLAVGLTSAGSLRTIAWVNAFLERPELRGAVRTALLILPHGVVFLAFVFVYRFIPHTSVAMTSAGVGACVATLLFASARELYVAMSIGAARAHALYGSLAALSTFAVFLYVFWVIVLLGAEFTAAHQQLDEQRVTRGGRDPAPGDREAIGLTVAAELARVFRIGRGGCDAAELAARFRVPLGAVRGVIADLVAANILSPLGSAAEERYQLGRAAECVSVAALREALRGPGEFHPPADAPGVRALLRQLELGAEGAVGSRTLADLSREAESTETAGPVSEDCFPAEKLRT